MRVFQFLSCYPDYFQHVSKLYPNTVGMSFTQRLQFLLWHGFNGPHILKPAYDSDPDFFVTFANDDALQQAWAREHGLQTQDLTEILLRQIEEHRPEVLYSLNPVRWGDDFLRRLPGCVKKTICWQASPPGRASFSKYDLRVCNFPNFLEAWEKQGLKSAFFAPSYYFPDDLRTDGPREIDIAFAGNYSAWHQGRNQILENLARLGNQHRVTFALLHPARKPLINLPLIRRIPGPFPYLPKSLRQVATAPVFGRELYELFSRAKIVLNASIEVAGAYRGNIRCYEAVSCGAYMLGQEGVYPDEFRGVPFSVYNSDSEAAKLTEALLRDPKELVRKGAEAKEMLAQRCSKEKQWEQFLALVDSIP
ncbi:MAG: glycosyltransferase family protein [Verrucomicrobiota bacterium]